MMQGDYGCANLDIFYSSQFVQGETQYNNGHEKFSYFILEHTPVLAGTLTGTIQLEDPGTKPIQTFTVSSSGKFEFGAVKFALDVSDVFAKTGELNLTTGELSLTFNKPPGRHRIVISYEYDMEGCNYGQ